MVPLPIDETVPRILQSLGQDRSLVLVAPPGSGKTTRVPPALLRSGLLDRGNPGIILLQPRRVAARGAAARIAFENGWAIGEEVGFQIRFEKRVGPRTRLVVETEGILNRQIVSDPFLEGIGAVILDEFHERSLHTDLAIAFLKEIRQTVRDDLILIVMSATLDPEPISRFLGDCPVIQSEGRTYPVEVSYHPTTRHFSGSAIAATIEEALKAPDDAGDILVFLPGLEEIRRTGSELSSLADRERLRILPLHGSLSADDQDLALRPSDRRKVILSTNIAETSLTIEGVRTVIDTGLARVAGHDAARGLDRLTLSRISRASADQRAGRAGRTQPGRCFRLWSEGEHRGLDPSDTPEIERLDLTSTLLSLHGWGVDEPKGFGWFSPPPDAPVEAGERLLELLEAIDPETGKITSLGRDLLKIPAHPRLGRLLIQAASEGYAREGATVAALLSEKDIVLQGGSGRNRPNVSRERGTSDILSRLDWFAEAELRNFSANLRDQGIDPVAARQVAKARDDLLRMCRRFLGRSDGRAEPIDDESVLRWVLLAYPDRVVRRRGSELTGVMVGGRGVRLTADSVVRDHEFFVALDPREDRRTGALEARVQVASAILPEWLDEFFPKSVRRERTVVYDSDRRRAVALSSVHYRDLLVKQDSSGRVEPSEASQALASSIDAEEFFRSEEGASNWLTRLGFLQRVMPELSWPSFDSEALAEILKEGSQGKGTLEDLRRVPWVSLFKGRLSYEQTRRMDEEAPESIAVPSGQRIRLTYEPERPPVLAVRLQEVFGWTETPKLAGGRVSVILHLLGPNYRPVQITEDLNNFWATTYFQVRKDLRAKYPRHAWPDEPLKAKAEAKGSRRRTD